MFDNGNDFVFGESRVEKNRSTVFGEALFAHFTLQESSVVSTVGVFHADIFSVSNAEGGALFIRAEKVFQVVHDKYCRYKVPRKQELRGKTRE